MPNIVEGIQNGLRQASRDLNRTINRTGGQISDAISNAAQNPNALGFDQINQTARDINRGLNRAKNAPVNANFDINPFNDGNVGVEFSGGGLNVRARAGLGPTGNISGIGASAGASLEGVGGVDISVGVDPTKGKVNYIPGISVKNAQGRTVTTTDPIELAQEVIRSINERLEAETNAAEAKAAGESIRFPGNRSSQSKPGSSQTRPQQKSSSNSKIQSPNLPTGTPRSIPQFGTPQQTVAPTGRIPSEFTPRREATQQPFTIPTDIPKTNTRLPRKPQIGSNTAQQNSGTNQRNGGITLGNAPRQNSSPSQRNGGISFGGNGAPQQDSRVNQRNSGRTIVSPEELEDISANNPNNKPRIVQPQQNSEPRSAYRLLSTREKQLFDCIQNGGGEACNSKYGEDPKPSSNNSNNEGFSLSLGDPYIGMGIQE